MGMLGEPDAPPLLTFFSFGGNPAGTFLVMGINAALFRREKTGKGDKLMAALYHAVIHNIALNLVTANFKEIHKNSRYTQTPPLPTLIFEPDQAINIRKL